MKKFTLILFCFVLLYGCKVNKYLYVTGGSKADGTLTMSYEYGAFEKPVIQWEEAKQRALQYCKSWGYSGFQFFDRGTQECISWGNSGCNRWRVTFTCQCMD